LRLQVVGLAKTTQLVDLAKTVRQVGLVKTIVSRFGYEQCG
jgi:hypothetical protein